MPAVLPIPDWRKSIPPEEIIEQRENPHYTARRPSYQDRGRGSDDRYYDQPLVNPRTDKNWQPARISTSPRSRQQHQSHWQDTEDRDHDARRRHDYRSKSPHNKMPKPDDRGHRSRSPAQDPGPRPARGAARFGTDRTGHGWDNRGSWFGK